MLKITLLTIIAALVTSFTNLNPNNWIEVYSNTKVSILTQTEGCEDLHNGTNKEYIFLKLKNKTSNVISVTYSLELSYNNKCYTCDNLDEYTFTQTLNPGQELVGDCESLDGLSIFSKMLDAASNTKLTNYQIKNIVVNE